MSDESPSAALEALLDRFFRAVSFATGERPRYPDLHDLFVDGGLLINTGSGVPEIWTVEQFIAPRQALVDSGVLTSFREVELSATTEAFGNVAHRFSGYDKKGVRDGVAFEAQGMITTQFVRTADGWRISSMAWDDERPGLAMPERYR
jgi:hypothetical protein